MKNLLLLVAVSASGVLALVMDAQTTTVTTPATGTTSGSTVTPAAPITPAAPAVVTPATPAPPAIVTPATPAPEAPSAATPVAATTPPTATEPTTQPSSRQPHHHDEGDLSFNPCVAAARFIIKGGGHPKVPGISNSGLPAQLFLECMKGYELWKLTHELHELLGEKP